MPVSSKRSLSVSKLFDVTAWEFSVSDKESCEEQPDEEESVSGLYYS
jgi:hypothetical protein